jgi:hypothetical protein
VSSRLSSFMGGLGMFLTRRRSDSLSCCLSDRTDGEEAVKQAGLGGPDTLNTPIPNI